MEQQNIPNVTLDDLVDEVRVSIREMHRALNDQRTKLGERYNHRNVYEQLARRFGEDPHKLIAEYDLILDKKSAQPASVREPVTAIVQTAINRLVYRMANEQQQKQNLTQPE